MLFRNTMFLFSVVATFAALVLFSAGALSRQENKTKPPLNVNDPKTWEPAVTRSLKERHEVTRALVFVARDAKRSNEDRRKSIMLLGRLSTKEAIEFLLANIALKLAPSDDKGKGAKLREAACLDSLCTYGKDWGVAQALFACLKAPKTETEVEYLGLALRQIVGLNVALIMTEDALAWRPEGDHKVNLERLKKELSK